MLTPRALHCSQQLDQNNALLFGGVTDPEENATIIEIYNFDTAMWRSMVTKFPCGIPRYTPTPCAIITNQTMVVPSEHMYGLNEPCTALLDLASMSWKRMTNDKRASSIGGHLAVFSNNKRLLYMGGVEHQSNAILDTIYEYLDMERGWVLWKKKLPLPFSNTSYVQVDNNVCLRSADVKKMTHLDPEGEIIGPTRAATIKSKENRCYFNTVSEVICGSTTLKGNT